MARNKHPEETVSLILDTAFRLFMEKGYERTSIQDIIDHLGGLSKGAIYHHFKSKEDILAAVVDRMTAESNHMLEEIRDRTDLTGKEKLKTIFKESISRPVMDEMFMIVPNLHDNPRLLHSIFREAVELVAPQYILPIIRQGISDGSIQTDYPAELAELIILTANIWTNPLIFNNSVDECSRKFMVFRQMMQGLGLDIVDDEMADRIRELTVIYWNNKR
ncbi:fatty acid metabolism regulator protein [Lachnospiraceae bacterium]|jgi:AcrR family transcriptional regulator|nr:TetR/AcrR family transcriptional regulator [Lachnospiraceae bacterium]GFI18454.1 fatty acid metabolism regulator protein [Lachnospiraceae bacterium]GFI70258.1 fatty acid metabolism regulator protein [Lachnospiraceae bacterium]